MTYVCSKCGEPIPLDDFESGRAVYTQGLSYCAKCVEAVLPMLKALEKHEKEEQISRVPVKSQPRMAMDHFASHTHTEQKSSKTGFVVIAVGAAVLLIVGLAFALSGNNNSSTTVPGGRTFHENSNPVMPALRQPGARQSWELSEGVRSFTQEEIDEISKAYESLEKAIDLQEDPFDRDTAKLEKFKDYRPMPGYWKMKIDRKIAAIEAAREKKAKAELDKYIARAAELAKEWKLKEALSHMNSFPEKLSSAGRVLSLLDEEKVRITKLMEQVEDFRETLEEAEKLLQDGNYKDVLALLDKRSKGQKLPPDLIGKISEMRSKVRVEVEKVKALEAQKIEEQRKKEEAAVRERERKYAETRKSAPLHYANWTSSRPSYTADTAISGAEHGKHGKKRYLVFAKDKKGSFGLRFSLGTKPEIALLTIVHASQKAGTDAPLAKVSFRMNDKISREFPVPVARETKELDISSMIKEGENIFEVKLVQENTCYLLSKVELRVLLPEKEMKKERARVRAYKKKLLAQAKKEEQKKRKNGNGKKKKRIPWPPTIKVGKTVSLFSGKDLSGWRVVGQGNWTVKDGAIVGAATGAQPTRLVTDFAGQAGWKNYDVELEIVLVRGKFYLGMHSVTDSSKAPSGLEVGLPLKANELTTVQASVVGTAMFVKVGEGAKRKAPSPTDKSVGGFHLDVEPNTEIRVKSIKFTLRSK